jgi:methionyl-tRNA formyltransferase
MKIAFAGTPDVAATVLNGLAAEFEVSLVLTRPDAPKGREQRPSPSPVAELAQSLGLPLVKSKKVDSTVLQQLKTSGAEMVIVVAYGALVPKSALDQIKWWNLHFSLLPNWRGATPLQHSMIFGTGQGITLFELDEGLDTGQIAAALPLSLDREMTAGEHLKQLAKIGTSLVIQNLRKPAVLTPQQGEATLAPKISRAQAKIAFERSASEIEARVMALNPEPVAWCDLDFGELRILRARAIGNIDWDALSAHELEPGTLEIRKNSVLVACGSGSRLELLEVQPSGKKPMSAVDWARGFSGTKIG